MTIFTNAIKLSTSKKLYIVIKSSLIPLVLFSIFSMPHSYADVSVGDPYEGGTVFCVSQTPDITKCITRGSGKYGLIMANEDQVNFDSNPKHGVTWTSKDDAVLAARSESDGAANTAAILAAFPKDNPNNNAAWACHNYRGGGKEGWVLPSKDELNKMYIFARANSLIGRDCTGIRPRDFHCLLGGYDNSQMAYWSSAESPDNVFPWFQCFRSGFQCDWDEHTIYLGVRSVRAFITPTVQTYNNLTHEQIRQEVKRLIHNAEETGSVDVAWFQEMPQGILNAEILLPILNWLKTNRTIKILNLANINLRAYIEQLADLLAVRSDFTTINLTNCNLDAASIRRLFLREHNEALTALYLGWNTIEDEDAGLLVEILQNNPALTILDLQANRIGDRGAAALAGILRNNTTLMALNLENNRIGNNGAGELAGALQNNGRLAVLYLGWNDIADRYYNSSFPMLIEALQNNPALIIYDLHNNRMDAETARNINEAYNKKILLRLLRKIKRASSFTFVMGTRHNITRDILTNILEYAGLNVRNRAAFEDVRDYDTAENRRVIFGGTLEAVIRLFYYGNQVDYAETIRELNQLRREQREFMLRNRLAILEGLVELTEDLPGVGSATLTPERVAAAFWPMS